MVHTSMLFTLFLLATQAMAGTVYINNLPIDTLPVAELKNVTVRFDAEGNIWIDAPNYQIREVAPPTYVSGTDATATTPTAGTGTVATGLWWLVTEDNGSSGSVVDVMVNGVRVRRVISGQSQLIMDIGPFLRPGLNEIQIIAQPGQPAGGMLSIYIGQGSNSSGTIRLDAPSVRYARRSSDPPDGGVKTFTVTVP